VHERSMDTEAILELLKAVRLRPTTPRVRILRLLADGESRPISSKDVYRILLLRGMHISVPAVYRTMRELADKGLVHGERGRRREARYRLGAEGLDATSRIRPVYWQ